VEEQIRRIIRDERAKDPLITVAGLEKALQKRFDRGFSHQYVSKIADKVAREGLIDADRTQIEERMNFTRENYRMMRDRLLRIIYWNPEEHPGERGPLNRDVIEAAKNIVMMDLALLQAEIANGMYKEPIDEITKEIRYDPLPDEVRTVIIAAWTLLIASRVTGSSWQTRPSQPIHPRTFHRIGKGRASRYECRRKQRMERVSGLLGCLRQHGSSGGLTCELERKSGLPTRCARPAVAAISSTEQVRPTYIKMATVLTEEINPGRWHVARQTLVL
jgi:hypothetical protein